MEASDYVGRSADDMVQCGVCGVLAFPGECECRGTIMPEARIMAEELMTQDDVAWLTDRTRKDTLNPNESWRWCNADRMARILATYAECARLRATLSSDLAAENRRLTDTLVALRAAIEERAALYDIDPDDTLLPESEETYADALVRWHHKQEKR